MKVPAERLQGWTARVFEKKGMAQQDAARVAKVLVWADLRGMGTHGVVRAPRYVELIDRGDLNVCPDMKVEDRSAACVVLDADRAAGPVAMTRGTELAVEKASVAGAGVCVVRATTHTAALGYYTHLATDAGMALIAVSGSSPIMAYHGARAAGVSTAPLAMAVPGEGGPIALDMASGVISLGRLAQARRNGETLPADHALDAAGNPTTDPRAAKLPLPLGGAKGSGLALLIECFASLLAGNALLAEALEGTPAGARHRQNGALIALDVARFLDLAQFRREAGRLVRAIKALPPQPGVEILLPGERGAREAEKRRREGIPLPAPVVEELRALARALHMEEIA